MRMAVRQIYVGARARWVACGSKQAGKRTVHRAVQLVALWQVSQKQDESFISRKYSAETGQITC